MNHVYLAVSIFLAIINAGMGLLLAMNPVWTIEMQRRAYALFNWRLEPISMSKEIRHMKIAGYFLIGLSVLAAAFVLIKSK